MPPLLVSLGVLGRRHNSPPKNTEITKTGCIVLSIVLLRRRSSIFKTSTTVFVQWNISLSLRLIFVSQMGWINDSLPSYTESVHVFSCYYGYSDGTGLNVFIIPNQRGEEERRERLKAFWPCGWEVLRTKGTNRTLAQCASHPDDRRLATHVPYLGSMFLALARF